jgi:hypothetical protein
MRFVTAAILALLVVCLAAPSQPGAQETNCCAALDKRVADLETRRWVLVGPVDADTKAQPYEHIIVNLATSADDVRIDLPPPNPIEAGSRVRVSEVSADGGAGNGRRLLVAGKFSPVAGLSWPVSPYAVGAVTTGDDSEIGAWIELVDIGDGWLIVAEGHRPALAGM